MKTVVLTDAQHRLALSIIDCAMGGVFEDAERMTKEGRDNEDEELEFLRNEWADMNDLLHALEHAKGNK